MKRISLEIHHEEAALEKLQLQNTEFISNNSPVMKEPTSQFDPSTYLDNLPYRIQAIKLGD